MDLGVLGRLRLSSLCVRVALIGHSSTCLGLTLSARTIVASARRAAAGVRALSTGLRLAPFVTFNLCLMPMVDRRCVGDLGLILILTRRGVDTCHRLALGRATNSRRYSSITKAGCSRTLSPH